MKIFPVTAGSASRPEGGEVFPVEQNAASACQHVHKGPYRRGKSPAEAQAWKCLADVEEQKNPRAGRGIIGKEVYSGGKADKHRGMER